MDAIDILKAEHGLIRLYLDNLAFALGKLERGEAVPMPFFEHAVSFTTDFLVGHHGAKEELQMARLLSLAKRGKLALPEHGIDDNHSICRNHMLCVAEAVPGYGAGEGPATVHLMEHLAAYVSLQRRHIYEEDHHLYPLAHEMLSGTDRVHLRAAFEEEDRKAGDAFLATCRNRVLEMESLLSR